MIPMTIIKQHIDCEAWDSIEDPVPYSVWERIDNK